MHLFIMQTWKKVRLKKGRRMKYVSQYLARRALEQSNGAMFLNRKLIVQLSTSRFRPQPKENTTPISPTTQQLMMSNNGSFPHPHHHHSTGGPRNAQQQQLSPLTPQYPYSDMNYDLMTSSNHPPTQSSSSPIPENSNFFRPPSPLSQDMSEYYSQYSNMSLDRLAATKLNPMKLNKPMKTGNSSRMDSIEEFDGSIPRMSNLLDTFAKYDGKIFSLKIC